MIKKSTDLEYFAATEDLNKLADSMLEKIRVWRRFCDDRGLTSLWKKKLSNYYGVALSGQSSMAITRGGSEGELSLIKVNDLHSLVQEQLVTVTSQRPAGIARAINTDTSSLKAAKIATGIAEYYMTEGDFESGFVQLAETALVCDEAFNDLYWDKSAGDPIAIDPESGEPEMSGDAKMRIHCPWNVARDPGIKTSSNKWYILSFRVNKFDAAAMYPNFYNAIISCSDNDDLPTVPMNVIPDGSDAIWAHLLVHDRTPSTPDGRYSLLIAQKIVLDTELPYKDFPVDRIAPTDVIDSCLGYAPANDILAMEEVTDALHSIITSNEITFGGQNLVLPEGNNFKVSDIAKGLRTFEAAPEVMDKIRALELCRTPPEIFNYIQTLGEKKGKAVGSVSQILAQQATQGASGSSMALIQTQSISYNSGIQKSYMGLLSSSMTKLIGILRTYADTERVAKLVGKLKSQGLKEFKYTGKDLNSISSIVYEIVNPIAQTQGGRLQMAQDLMNAGQIKSPKQYINVVATGQLDVLTWDDEEDGLSILEENEALTEGRFVQAIVTEIHADHIKSHNSLLTQDAKERDPELVQRVLDHVQEHINLWMQASISNPGILLATGQQPLMPPQGMMPPQAGAPQGPPPEMVGNGQPPVETKADETRQPNLPTIAGTDEKPTVPGVTDAVA